MQVFERWAQQLGVKWESVLRNAGVANPKTARATRNRMKDGGAPRTRRQLMDELKKLEQQRSEHTEIGALMLAYEEWQDIGAKLARLDPAQFLRLLDRARTVAAGSEALAEIDHD